ncbi:hypothetical protein [uncultured Methylibium sp.]|uniref:hypothetical protein n=1 Tax=uncultured Methylibium sp. TaxID=381093 RepID=UPI0025EA11C5|nr:hypothetical protein [uncultured Methylibium sp.]
MPKLRLSLLLVSALVGTASLAHAQGYSDSQRQHEERQRQDSAQRAAEAQRATDYLVEDIRRDRERWAPGSGGSTQAGGEGSSFATRAAGLAAVVVTAALLHELFVSGNAASAGSRVPPGARLDPAIDRWLQDPRNRPGEPIRFDTPDGMISKVCLRPFPGVQTVVYRWDAPGEVARAVDVRETPTREHMQFTHPTARGLFIYVTKPAPDHKPSDQVYWLGAHRIGMTGCGHAQAYQIAYHQFGGVPEFERVAQPPRIRQEEPVENLPTFMRTCQAHHTQAACACLFFPVRREIPDLEKRAYDRAEISAALRRQRGALEQVARNCRLQF